MVALNRKSDFSLNMEDFLTVRLNDLIQKTGRHLSFESVKLAHAFKYLDPHLMDCDIFVIQYFAPIL